MTVVVVTRLRRFEQNDKLKFEAGYENSFRLLTKRAEYAILIYI
jgi:hypothetical protein